MFQVVFHLDRHPTPKWTSKNSPKSPSKHIHESLLSDIRFSIFTWITDDFYTFCIFVQNPRCIQVFLGSFLAHFCMTSSYFWAVRNFLPVSRRQQKKVLMTIAPHFSPKSSSENRFTHILVPLSQKYLFKKIKVPILCNTLYSRHRFFISFGRSSSSSSVMKNCSFSNYASQHSLDNFGSSGSCSNLRS